MIYNNEGQPHLPSSVSSFKSGIHTCKISYYTAILCVRCISEKFSSEKKTRWSCKLGSFQSTYMSREDHARVNNGGQREDNTTHNFASTVSFGISERQRSRLCGQNLSGPFMRAVLAMDIDEQWRLMAQQKCL